MLGVPGLREGGWRAPKILPRVPYGLQEWRWMLLPLPPALPVGGGRDGEGSRGSTGTPQDTEVVSERSTEGGGHSARGAGIPAWGR